MGIPGPFDFPDAPTAGVVAKSDAEAVHVEGRKQGCGRGGAGGVVQSQARLSSPVVWCHRSEEK